MFIEQIKKEYQSRYGTQKTISDSSINELKVYLRDEFIHKNNDFVTIYVCNGGSVRCGFPNISTDEKYTIHSAFKDSLISWLTDNGFMFTTKDLQVGGNEYPPAHGGWISQRDISVILISAENIKQ